MWFRLINKYNFIYSSRPLAITRIHSGQGSYEINAKDEIIQFWKNIVDYLYFNNDFERIKTIAQNTSVSFKMISTYSLEKYKNYNYKSYKKIKRNLLMKKIFLQNIIIRKIEFIIKKWF